MIGMAEPQVTRDPSRHAPERAMAPIRWPHPGSGTFMLIGVWVLGMLIAVFVPALIVPPGAQEAPTGEVFAAFACTVAGAAVMIGAGWRLHRKYDEPLAWSFGLVPGVTVVVGGIIMAATKLASS